MNHPDDQPGGVQGPPPPCPGPADPVELRLCIAAADVIAFAFNDCLHLPDTRLLHARPDLQLLLRAHLAPALDLAGLPSGSTARGCVLRLVVSVLHRAAAVREADLPVYLASITAVQQRELLILAHHALLAQQPSTFGYRPARPLPLYALAEDGRIGTLPEPPGERDCGDEAVHAPCEVLLTFLVPAEDGERLSTRTTEEGQ